MNILVTGGQGYIGSHVCLELLRAGHSVVSIDNSCNSYSVITDKLAKFAESLPGKEPFSFEPLDLLEIGPDCSLLEYPQFDAVIHLAGLKSVAESVQGPMEYWEANLGATYCMLRLVEMLKIKKIIFSSSATVYGEPTALPLTTSSPLDPRSPYGSTKLACESLLKDFVGANLEVSVNILRYFNPAGADADLVIGEYPRGAPNNLFPALVYAAYNKHSILVHGNDYDTRDGTAVRDYVHVSDVALAHLSALERDAPGWSISNVGSGHGYTVLEVLTTFQRVNNVTLDIHYTPRRPGDVPSVYCSSTEPQQHSLATMCSTSWEWYQKLRKEMK